MRGMCHWCFIRGCNSVPRHLEGWLSSSSSIWTTGIPAPSWKGNATMGDIDLLSICPIPQIEWHPFNCRAKTAMEQEIMEDITLWSFAKSAPYPPLSQGWSAGESRAYNTSELRLCSSHHFHAALRWFPNILSALRRDKPIVPKHGCHAYKPFTALKNPLWLLHKHGDSKGHFAQAHLLF